MKAALLRPLYPAVGGFTTVYAATDGTSDTIVKQWQEAREDLAGTGVRAATLEAIEFVLSDPDTGAPAHAIFARDGHVVGIIALRAMPETPVAQVSPLPHVRHALADAPLLEPSAEQAQLAIMAGAGIDVGARVRTAVLTAATDVEALRVASDELRHRLAALHDRDESAHGVAATVAALRDGRVATIFLRSDPALAEPAWIGPAGTELAMSSAELAEAGLLAPLRDRTDEAIIRAAATTNAELFILPDEHDYPADLPDGVAATLRYPRPMS